MKRLYVVTASVCTTRSMLVWADSLKAAESEAEFDNDDLDWHSRFSREADDVDVILTPYQQIWDGNRYRDAMELSDLCTPEAIDRREREERERAEFDAHPKLEFA